MNVSVRRSGPFLFLLGLMLALFAGPAAAQETGKVEGRVTSDAGQPLSGAQVVVLGTRLGNITNQDGYYFINNVPAGLQDVQAQYIGYQSVTVRQQRILAGQTTTLSFKLAQGAVAIEAIQVVGERAPLVPRDQVASKNIVTGESIDQMPVDNVRRVITLQPGVVETGRSKGVSIRGGRSGEEAVYVDGVLVRNYSQGASTGTNNLQMGTNALSEADVITGGFAAEYGEAQSGIVNYVTKTGGRKWTGAGSLATDEWAPKKVGLGFNRGELSLGGPLVSGLSFFGAVTAQGQRYADTGIMYRDMPIWYPNGVDTTVTTSTADGLQTVVIPKYTAYNGQGRLPMSNSDAYTATGKIDWSYGSGSRIFLSVDASRNQGRNAPIGGLYNPGQWGGGIAKNHQFILGWTQNFVKSAEHALALDMKASYSDATALSGVLDPTWEVNHRDPFLGFTPSTFRFAVEPDCKGLAGCTNFPVDQHLVDMLLTNTQTDSTGRKSTPYGVGNTTVSNAAPFRLNPFGVASTYATVGDNGTFNYTGEKDLQFRGSVDWQANRYNRVKFGGDYTTIETRSAGITYNSLSFAQAWFEKPKRASAFAQDRIDLGDLVIEAGLRVDHFDPNSTFANTAGYLVPDDPTTFHKAPAQTAISPRLGVSFPVTVNSTFRLSYGHFVQTPDLNLEFGGKNTDYFRFKNTNTNDVFARPLQMPRKINFEFGFRQLLGPDFVMDISAYNRDARGDIAFRKLAWADPTNPGVVAYLNTVTNADFGTTRGIDLKFDRRFSRVFSGQLNYSYLDARNTGSDPNTYTQLYARLEGNANTILGLPPNPPNAMHITEENRTHNITGMFNASVPADESSVPKVLRDFSVNGTVRFVSGLPYTKVTGVGNAIVIGPPTNIGLAGTLADQEVETGRTPWVKNVDLRISRGIKLAGTRAQVFFQASNLFDFVNKNQVFLSTGDVADQSVYNSLVSGAMTDAGAGTQHDIDLRSFAASGATNEVNWVALQRTEALFGNGDQVFTLDEQRKAFMANVLNNGGIRGQEGSGRRMRLGIDFTF